MDRSRSPIMSNILLVYIPASSSRLGVRTPRYTMIIRTFTSVTCHFSFGAGGAHNDNQRLAVD